MAFLPKAGQEGEKGIDRRIVPTLMRSHRSIEDSSYSGLEYRFASNTDTTLRRDGRDGDTRRN